MAGDIDRAWIYGNVFNYVNDYPPTKFWNYTELQCQSDIELDSCCNKHIYYSTSANSAIYCIHCQKMQRTVC